MDMANIVVNSWNEWDPLKRMIVGRADGTMVQAPEPALDGYPPLSFCSQSLSMNTLMLDPKTICVHAQEVKQMEQFDDLGLEVIPAPFTDVSAFGEGLHCAYSFLY